MENEKESGKKGAKFHELFDFRVYNGEVSILSYIGTQSCVEIPATYKGKPVTSINDNAFEDCSFLTDVTIPSSIIDVSEEIFYTCEKLVHLTNLSNIPIESHAYVHGEVRTSTDEEWSNTLYEDDNGVQTYTVGDKVYFISYTGDSEVLDLSSYTHITDTYPYALAFNDELTEVLLPSTLKRLGISTFSDCTSLTEIVLPQGLVDIGLETFDGCSMLKSISIPNSVKAIGSYVFNECAELGSVTMQEGITSIGDCAFFKRSSLKNVVIPQSVIEIGEFAFADCPGLSDVPSRLTNIGGRAFSNTEWYNKQPNGMIYIGEVAYGYKGEMQAGTEIVLRDGTTQVAGYAFADYYELVSITLPDSIVSIGKRAFSGCKGLTSITIPSKVTDIGMRAFYKCTGLASVYVDDLGAWCGISFQDDSANPLSITHRLFVNNKPLTNLVVPAEVTAIGEYAFCYLTELESVVIQNGVTAIGHGAFLGCNSLVSVIVPGSIKCIESFAFSECEALVEIVLSDGVESIEHNAFGNCNSLTSIVIPSSVKHVGYCAFESNKMKTIYCRAESEPDGWDEDWIQFWTTVFWGYKGK